MSRRKINSVDVVIVGAGLCGLSTAYHLKKLGLRSFLLLDSMPQSSESSKLDPGVAVAGLVDNFTRIHHQLGKKRAFEVWEFSFRALKALEASCSSLGVPFLSGDRFRGAMSDHELKEVREALKLLSAFSIKETLIEQGLGEIVAFQYLQGGSSVLSGKLLCDRLKDAVGEALVCNQFRSHQLDANGIEILTTDLTSIRAQILVLCHHLGAKSFNDRLSEILVPTSEQWSQFRLNRPLSSRFSPGDALILNHGNETIFFSDERLLEVGGARFLRSMAGIGGYDITPLEKISKFHAQRIRNIFNLVAEDIDHIGTKIGLDCRPCDELPLIGPLFGENRVLIGAGFMGQGLSFAYLAGRCLADFIVSGKSNDCPSCLSPLRFRNLGEHS